MVVSIHDEIKLHYKYKISYNKAWVAKQKVNEHLFSSMLLHVMPKINWTSHSLLMVITRLHNEMDIRESHAC